MSFLRNLLLVMILLGTTSVHGQPKITSFNPSSGPVGTSVVISGSGFNAVPANNTVYFGPVKAPVTSASVISLTVTVPAGTATQTLSVLNNATGLTGYSTGQYITTYANTAGSGLGPSFFQPLLNIVTPYQKRQITISDIDGDGKPDLLFAPSEQGNDSVYVMKNISSTGSLTTGSFAPAVGFRAGGTVFYLSVSDLDGDGKKDILATSPNENTIAILRNTSTAGTVNTSSFAPPVQITGILPASNTIVDVDGDGKPDMLVVQQVSSSASGGSVISVFRNLSTPGNLTAATFAPAVNFSAGPFFYNPASIALGDIDGDGKPDLVVNNLTGAFNTGSLSVFRNTAVPGAVTISSFASPVELAINGSTLAVAINDADGDGKPDLVATTGKFNSSNSVGIFRNVSTPGSITAASFAPRVDFATGDNTRDFTIADIDGDGKPDIMVLQGISGDFNNSGAVLTLRNNTTAGSITASSFTPTAEVFAGDYPFSISVGDLDTDGKPEIVMGNIDLTGAVSILKVKEQPLAPVITALSPSSAPAGATVTITGANFNSIPANNIVYFGAVRATVTSSTVSSLTVTVPAGATYQPVSVLSNATGLTAYSPQPFTPSFINTAGSGFGASYYKPRIDLSTYSPAGSYPYASAIGDLDGDGKPDMAVVNVNANTVTILRNTSPAGNVDAASFTERATFATGPEPFSVVIGDVDGDGKPDLIVGNHGNGTVSVLRNITIPRTITGASFAPKVDFPVDQYAYSFFTALGDVNSDGKPEIIIANTNYNYISILPNNSAPGSITASSFGTKVDISAGKTPRSVAVGDIDGDGRPDIAVANQGNNNISVLRNVSASVEISRFSFQGSSQQFATGNAPDLIVISDIDGDGKPDLAAANFNSNTVSVLRNTHSSGGFTINSFAAKVDFPTGNQPFYLSAGDADGDGKPDLIVANAGSNTLSILRNTAVPGTIDASSFASRADYATGTYPVSVLIADLDGDGIAEATALNAGSGRISVLKINLVTPPVISSFSPASGPAGTTVTITGTNFSATPGNNIVYFGAARATVVTGSSTSLRVTVPASATYLPLSVLNSENNLTGYAATPFITTYTNPFGSGIPSNFYLPKIDFSTGPLPYATALGDLDGDGKNDLVTVNVNANSISVLRNTSTASGNNKPSFDLKVDFATGANPRAVIIRDVDGDGKLDLIVLNSASATISVLRNTSTMGTVGASSFAPKVDFATGSLSSPYSVAVGDLNSDGRPDLVVANLLTNSVSILRNTTTTGSVTPSSFASRVEFTTGVYPRYIAITDLDGDGKDDLAIANERANSVSVLRNTTVTASLFSFAGKVDFATGSSPNCVVAGDVDGDGKAELVISNYASSNVSVLRNTSTPGSNTVSFAAKADFATGINPFCVTLGDADGDGKIDLVTANAGANTISVLRNTSTAGSLTASSFTGKVDFASSGYPLYVTMGDVSGDGIAEAVAANGATNTVSVFCVNIPLPGVTAAAGMQAAGLLKPDDMAVGVYPNPARETVSIALVKLKAPGITLEVFNEAGSIVQRRIINTAKTTGRLVVQLDMHEQPAGVYYVKVTGVDGVHIAKLVLQ